MKGTWILPATLHLSVPFQGPPSLQILMTSCFVIKAAQPRCQGSGSSIPLKQACPGESSVSDKGCSLSEGSLDGRTPPWWGNRPLWDESDDWLSIYVCRLVFILETTETNVLSTFSTCGWYMWLGSGPEPIRELRPAAVGTVWGVSGLIVQSLSSMTPSGPQRHLKCLQSKF